MQDYRPFSSVFRQWLLDNDYRLVDDPFKRWAKENGHEQWMVEYAHLQPEQEISPITAKPSKRAAASPVIFISYSHMDRKYKDALLRHLRILEGAELVEDIWTDDTIAAGENWEARINEAIARAQVAIFLISADSLNSAFIRSREIPDLITPTGVGRSRGYSGRCTALCLGEGKLVAEYAGSAHRWQSFESCWRPSPR